MTATSSQLAMSVHNRHMLHCVLQAMVVQKDPKDAKAIHILSSGIKAAATWGRVEILQHCRECCGGQGFLAANKIGWA